MAIIALLPRRRYVVKNLPLPAGPIRMRSRSPPNADHNDGTPPSPVQAFGTPAVISTGGLRQTMSTASPRKCRDAIGTALFCRVERILPDLAPKITGMLLEGFLGSGDTWDDDRGKKLHAVLDSPEALSAWVAEALRVILHARAASCDKSECA